MSKAGTSLLESMPAGRDTGKDTGRDTGRDSTSRNLAQLCIIRWIVLLLQSASLIVLTYYAVEETDLPALIIVMILMSLVTSITHVSLKANRYISELEFFAHLLIDVGYLTIVLYLAGGSTNPFVSYYLIPLIISAAVLNG